MKRMTRWGVFVSGTGSNMGALLEIPMEVNVACVVSSRKDAPGLKRAQRAGIPTFVFEKTSSWESLTAFLLGFQVEAIFLCGFMRILPRDFISQWHGRILNVHPSLLPLYPGTKSIQRAFDEKKPLGVTVHEVIEEVDAGRRILQREVRTAPTIEGSEFMVHVTEHKLVREAATSWIPA